MSQDGLMPANYELYNNQSTLTGASVYDNYFTMNKYDYYYLKTEQVALLFEKKQ